jgi:sec-independent protein translocase protein TatA
MPGNIGPMEIILVLVIALLVLGPKKLPEVGRSVGKGLREFKDGVAGIAGDRDDDEPSGPPRPPVLRAEATTTTPAPAVDPEPAVTGAPRESQES